MQLPDEPHLITKAAIGGDTKHVALQLVKTGSYVQQMTEGPEKDRYSRFLQLYYSVPDAGAEVFYADFLRRHHERMSASNQRLEIESKAIQDVLQLGADFNAAAYQKDDAGVIKRGIRLLNAIGTLIAISRRRYANNEELSEESRSPAAA